MKFRRKAPRDSEVEEVKLRLTPRSQAELAQQSDGPQAPPRVDGERTIFRAPADSPGFPAQHTDHPDDTPQTVELSPKARAAVEARRESARPADPPRTDTGEPVIFRPPADAPERSLGYAPDDREDPAEATVVRSPNFAPTVEHD